MTQTTDTAMRLDELVSELGWIRRVARALVDDGATADDVAQDAWLAARAQPPAAAGPVRPWLRRVVVNVARMRHRAGRRREARERVSDGLWAREVASPAELVERVELQRVVAGEVLALREPYRSTVLLCFFEELSSAEVARRLGVPDGTVRRRLKVALDELRGRLAARSDGPKAGWLAALAPLAKLPGAASAAQGAGAASAAQGAGAALAAQAAGAASTAAAAGAASTAAVPGAAVPGAASPGAASAANLPGAASAAALPTAALPGAASAATTLGALAMKKLIVLVVLLLVVVLAGLWWRGRAPEAAAEAPILAARVERAAPAAGPPPAQLAWLAQPGVANRRVAGHVRSADGPVPGARVRLALISAPGAFELVAERRTTADGAFDFGPQPAASFLVSAEAPQYAAASLRFSVADPGSTPEALALRLGACRSRLHGTVLDASGGVIARARISDRELGGVESDERGQFELCMPDHNSWVRVEAQGYGSVVMPLRMWGTLRRDVVLVPEAVIAGHVVADGAPVAGARVTARPDEASRGELGDARWTTTGDDGRFQLTGLAPGRFQLVAAADGLGLALPVLALARPAAASPEIRIALDRLAEIRGRVVRDGRPVTGARVVAVRDHEILGAPAYSQADGSFVLARVPRGSVRLIARPYEVRSPGAITVDRAVVDGVVLDVATLATVRGHVTRRGLPVEGTDVTLVGSRLRAQTDANGAFAIEGLPAGNYLVHAVSLDVRAAAEDQPITLAAGEDRAVQLELEHAGQVTGVVVDEAGQPVAGAYVRLARPGRSPTTRGGEAMTDEHGAFDAGGIPAGDYVAEVFPAPMPAHAFPPARGALPSVRVPRDGAATGVVLAIQHVRVAIRGTLVDDTGAAVADAAITAVGGLDFGTMAPPSTRSDVAGRFEIAGLARGAYRIRAHAADGSTAELPEVAAGGAPITVALVRPGALDAVLVGFSSPPTVELRGGPASGARRALVEAGHASVTALPPGSYTVQARAGAELDSQTVEVRAGQTTRVVLQPHRLGRVEGRVVEHGSGAPVAGMRCGTMLASAADSRTPPDPALQAVTDGAGQFAAAAPVGRVRVACMPPGGGPLSLAGADVDVTGDRAATVALVTVRDTRGSARSDPGFTLTRGVLPLTVGAVVPGGPAAAAGVAVGDHLISIDGAALGGMLPMGAATLLGNQPPGATITLGVERAGAAQTLSLTLPRR